MKKSITILISVTLYSFSSLAQPSSLAIKGAFNSSRLESDNQSMVDVSSRSGYNLGLVYTYESRNIPFGFSMEPGYTLKGAKIGIDTVDYKLDYFSLPLLLDYYPIRKVRISVGPEISYLVKARNVGAKKQLVDTVQVIDITNNFDNRWEISAAFGVSYSLEFFLDVGLRYNRGLTKISKFDAILDRRNLYNRYFQIFLLIKIAN